MRCKQERRWLTDEEMLYLGIQRKTRSVVEVAQKIVLKMKLIIRRRRR